MKYTIIFLLLLFTASAQQIEETITVKKSDLTPEQLSLLETKSKVNEYGEWVGLGKEVGIAFDESLKAITEHTAKFADTKVGHWLMFIITWKVIGKDLVQIIVGPIIWVIGMVIMIFFMYKAVTWKTYISGYDDGKPIYSKIAPASDNEPGSYYSLGAFFLFVWTGICMAITFA